MNQNLPSILKGGLIMLALLALGINANATTFTATTSGNFSSAATWSGGTAPGTNITVDDDIIINTGVTVNLDVDLTINSANASVLANGTLTGMHNLDFQDGSLQGAGSINVATLTMGALSTSAYLGDITAINLFNYQSTLLLAGATHITGTLGLYAGTVQLGVGTQVVMDNGSTIEMGGGNYQLGTGNITLQGNVNLLYSGLGNRNMGVEMSLSPINSITVNMATGSQINMADDVVLTGQLSVQGGSLNTNGFDLTVNGTVATSGSGRFMGDSSSIINVNGSGNVGMLAFDSANSVIDALNINISGNGSVSLGSNLTANNGVGLTSGALVIGNNHLTTYGPITGSGTFSTTSGSSLTVNHSGNNNYLNFTAGADTIGNLSISSGVSGSAGIGTDLTVTGMLNLGSGTFNIDQRNLTLNGTLDSTG
nr:hypothetical protein [Chitinophagales bacterium]